MGARSEPRDYVFASVAGTRTRVLRLAVPTAAVAALGVTAALVLAVLSGAPVPGLLGLPDQSDPSVSDQSVATPGRPNSAIPAEPTGTPASGTTTRVLATTAPVQPLHCRAGRPVDSPRIGQPGRVAIGGHRRAATQQHPDCDRGGSDSLRRREQ